MGKIAKVGKNRHKTNGTNLLRAHTSAMGAMDLSRFDAAPLIAFTATKEINYGTETDERISARCGAYRADQ